MTPTPSFAFTRRATSRAKAAIALAAAVVLGYVVAAAQAHDPRLDEAHQALQKAFALVEASQTGGAPPRTQRHFDQHRARAMDFITRAMEEVILAGEVADGQ